MTLTIQERSLFLRRAGEGFEHQQRWARQLGKYLPYRLQDLHAKLRRAAAEPAVTS